MELCVWLLPLRVQDRATESHSPLLVHVRKGGASDGSRVYPKSQEYCATEPSAVLSL